LVPSKVGASAHPDSTFTKRSHFSSTCTTKRFPSPRCASAIQIVRPLESIAETQPKLQPCFSRLSACHDTLLWLISFSLDAFDHLRMNIAQELERLAKLHADRMLSDEEFTKA